MSENEQSSTQPKDQLVTRHASMLLPTVLTPAVIPRTLTLIATISLVAFALYMTRPHGALPFIGTGMHAVSSENPHHTPVLPGASRSNSDDATGKAQQSSGSSPNLSSTVTVNGKSIPVPADGNLNQTIQDGGSTTTVHISSGGNGSTTSTVDINSSSSTESSSGSGT